MPWQSVQTGASELPRLMACPWMLCVNSVATDSWHLAQVSGTLNLKMEDLSITGAANFVGGVTIGADGGLGGSGSYGAPVHAFLIGIELLRALAVPLHHEFLRVTVGAGGRNVGMMNRRLGIFGCQNLVRAAMAGDTRRRL